MFKHVKNFLFSSETIIYHSNDENFETLLSYGSPKVKIETGTLIIIT